MNKEPVAIVTGGIAVLNVLLLAVFDEQMGEGTAAALAVVLTGALGWIARSKVWSRSSLGKGGPTPSVPLRGPRAGEPFQ